MNYYPVDLSEHAALERLRISHAQFKALPEYSLTRPTGVFIGKLWRSMTTCGRWVVFGYLEHPTDNTKCRIKIWKPFFTAGHSRYVAQCRRDYDKDVKERLG